MPIEESTRGPTSGRVHAVPEGTVSKRRERVSLVAEVPTTLVAPQAEETAVASASSADGRDSAADSASDVPTDATQGAAEGSDSSAFEAASSASSGSGASADSGSGATDRSEDAEAINEPQGPILMDLYKEGCVACGHFNTLSTKFQSKCHFSEGNEDCPAKVVQLRVRVPIEKIAASLAKYQFLGDIENYNRISNKVVEHHRQGKVTSAEFQEIKLRETEVHAQLKEEARQKRRAEKKARKEKKHRK